MHRPCFRRLTLSAAMLGIVGMASAGSLAQSTPVLKGPEVKDRNVPGVASEFGSSGQRRFVDRMPPEVFRRALGVLTADDAPADLRATDEQRTQFKELAQEFEQRVREYRRTHGKEIAELRKRAGELAGPRDAKRGDAKPAEPEAMRDVSVDEQRQRDEARAKLRELTEGAPKIDDVYTKVWAGLSDPQRRAVDAELEKFRAEQARQREDQYVRQRVKKNEPAAPDAGTNMTGPDDAMKPGAPPDRPARGRMSPERRERLMRLFENLSPEEQDQLLSRLEERLKDRVPARENGNKGARTRTVKPAPNPDDVVVPSPGTEK